jgi:hypothetical protein
MDRSMTDPFAKLTQVGPGSPTGEFFRQFRLPTARPSEFEADGAPIRLRRRLLKAVDAYATTGDLPATPDDTGLTRGLMSGSGHVPEGTEGVGA